VTPLTENAQAVFAALRDADELEVEGAVICAKADLRKGQYIAAVRDLRARGLVKSRREGYRVFLSLNQQPVKS
jgi:predicted transcriptional regulator